MNIFQHLGEKILGKGKSLIERLLHFLLLILLFIILDYYTDFPLGYIQLNQLEQINQLEELLDSKKLDSTQKVKLKHAHSQVYNKYQFLFDLRFSFNQIPNSLAPQKSAIQNINTTIYNTRTGIPYFLCLSYGHALISTFWWVIFAIFLLTNIFKTEDVKGDLIGIGIIIFLYLIAFFFFCFCKMEASCTTINTICFSINTFATVLLVIIIHFNTPNEKVKER